jgi:hypothetical protein
MKIQVTITRNPWNGSLNCSTVFNGRLVSRNYYGFTMSQARREFIADLETL